MTRGEIVLLWIAGLWTALVSIVLLLVSFASGDVSSGYLVWLILASLPLWIICGLIWATAYGRSKRKSSSKINETPSERINEWNESIATLRGLAPNEILGTVIILVIGGLIIAGMAGTVYLLWHLIGYWVDLSAFTRPYRSPTLLSPLFDTEWKITGWKIAMMIGTAVVIPIWIREALMSINFKMLHRTRCEYCSCWNWMLEAAELCCLTRPPTKVWIRRHKLWNKRDMAWWGLLVFLLQGVLASLYLVALSAAFGIFESGFFDVNAWFSILPVVYIVLGYAYFYKGVYRDHFIAPRRCTVCGVRADGYNSKAGLPLCSRCYAQMYAEMRYHQQGTIREIRKKHEWLYEHRYDRVPESNGASRYCDVYPELREWEAKGGPPHLQRGEE